MKKFVKPSPLSDPETAARKLIEIANGVEGNAGRPYPVVDHLELLG